MSQTSTFCRGNNFILNVVYRSLVSIFNERSIQAHLVEIRATKRMHAEMCRFSRAHGLPIPSENTVRKEKKNRLVAVNRDRYDHNPLIGVFGPFPRQIGYHGISNDPYFGPKKPTSTYRGR